MKTEHPECRRYTWSKEEEDHVSTVGPYVGVVEPLRERRKGTISRTEDTGTEGETNE